MRLVPALLLAAPLFAQCTYTLDKTTVNIPAAGGTTTTINITTQSACRWLPSVTAGSSFIHLGATSQQIVTGSGSFTFSVDANPIGQARTGTITIQGDTTANVFMNVTHDAAVCNFAFSPTSQNFSANGGSGAVLVTANCAWAVSNSVGNWVNIPFSTSGGITNATVPFTVAGNPCITGRSGTIVLNGSTLSKPLTSTVNQDGSPQNFSLSGTSINADSTANDYRFGVTTGTGCGWGASSDVSWMQIISGASGNGNGNISFHLIANTSATRTGNIHVNAGGGFQFLYTVTQAAASPAATTVAAVSNVGNYATDAVSPGEIVAIFGQNMGPPAPGVPLQISGGLLTTTLGGTQVLFDSVPAPIIFSRDTQVNAIVPYGVKGKTSTQVQVSYNGAISAAVTMPVQDTTPAILTLDQSGRGPGAILNQDFSINSSSLPAARGSIVAIYCTGGGTLNPAVADGAVLGAIVPRLQQSVSVTMGGVDAKVTYAGGVSQSVAGLVQVNAEVPASLTPDPKVPIVVTIGGVSSSAGVTVAVK
jgi:uncharacterized protein (TIGR03437 family)